MKIMKRRAISPAIATMLLIAVTIVSGVAVISTVYIVMTTEDPLSITINKPEHFASTEVDKAFFDPMVDSILIPITNNMREPLVIDMTQVLVFNASSGEQLDLWYATGKNEHIVFQGQETAILQLETEGKYDDQELAPGDEFYITVPVKRSDNQNFETFTSQIFKVSSTDTQPLFALVPISSPNQQETTVYFDIDDSINQSRDLQVGIFNYGNAIAEKSFSVTLQLENSALFSTNTSFDVITVPRSFATNNDTFCEFGEACAIVSFNITKWDMTRTKDTYSATVSIGSQSLEFDLFFYEVPNYYVTMPNSRSRRRDNNQWGEVLQFNSRRYWREETLDLRIIAWNNESFDSDLEATLEIIDLNTTAFTLESSTSVTHTIPNGNSLPSIPDESSRCRTWWRRNNLPCREYTWTITRNIIQEFGRNPTVYYTVMESYYYFKIKWVDADLEFEFRIQVRPPFQWPWGRA